MGGRRWCFTIAQCAGEEVGDGKVAVVFHSSAVRCARNSYPMRDALAGMAACIGATRECHALLTVHARLTSWRCIPTSRVP